MTKRKFGKKNVVSNNPADYGIGIIGESGIGKTTVMKEVCEKLLGETGYIIGNMGMENGVDAIADAIYEDFPDFETLTDFVDDVEENPEEYKELKVFIADTLDEWFRITELEVIRLHNKDNPDKKVKTINSAFGGYGRGEDKVVELILDVIDRLNAHGIKTWVVGHTKRKSVSDIVTGEDYETLTSNMMAKYFNSIKTKLHILGVASINRDIEKVKVKQKMSKEDKIIGKVKGESRVITFRDDNFNIDSKSRFADIVPQIDLDADQFIKAIQDAIAEANKKHKNKEASQVHNEEVNKVQAEHKEATEVNEETNQKVIDKLTEMIPQLDDLTKVAVVNAIKALDVTTVDALIDKPTVKVLEIASLLVKK